MADTYLETIKAMGRDVYDRMVDALATGRWPDGKAVTATQREHCMQAVIAWGNLYLPPEERVGYIDKGHKGGEQCEDDTVTLKWQDETL